MNKAESKYQHTAKLMDEALLSLLDKKAFDYITIKDVCAKAGVNRSTFYLHYTHMGELLTETIEYLQDELAKKFIDKEMNVHTDELRKLKWFTPEFSVPYLEYLQEYKKAFMSALAQPNLFGNDHIFEQQYQKYFVPIMDKFQVPAAESKYLVKFCVSGIHAIIIEWLKNDCRDDINFIANLIARYVDQKGNYESAVK